MGLILYITEISLPFQVSGDSNEAQILVAGQQYLDRPAMLENVLNDLFHIFRIQDCANVRGVMDVILLAMDRHPGEKVRLNFSSSRPFKGVDEPFVTAEVETLLI